VIRLIIWLAIAVGLVVCSATVPLGDKTFFGHIRAVFGGSEELDELDRAGKAVRKGAEEGIKTYKEEQQRQKAAGTGTGTGTGTAAGTGK
jgi:hypothetical protein